MKKFFATIIAVVLAACMLVSVAACGGNAHTGLNIVALSAGYGREWLDEIAARYTAETGVEVNLTAEYSAENLIRSHLSGSNNQDDLYICTDASWKTYAAQGKFLDLTDFVDETVDGVAIKTKLADEYKDSIYYTDHRGETHVYRLPWTAGTGGIYYNAKMFEDNKWPIPTTVEELKELCTTINNAELPVAGDRMETVKPFVYTGQNTDYFDYVVFTWWAQLAGVDAIDEFLKYENYTNFDAATSATYGYLEDAVEAWAELFTAENCVTNCQDKSNHVAQQNFVNGYAAMMFNADWIYNEILGYSNADVDMSNFALALMDTPAIDGAQYRNVNYVVGEDQFIAIPATSTMADEAKEFIKYIVSDDGIETFFEKAHSILAYDSTAPLTTSDTVLSKVLSVREKSTSFTDYSDSLLYLANQVNIWGTSAWRPFMNVLNGTSTVATAFTTIASSAESNWPTWLANVGLS